MKDSELHALRCLRKALVDIGKTAMNVEDERLKATLKGKISDAHGIAFLLCAPYHERALP